MAGDAGKLTASLVSLLGWEQQAVEPIVEAIAAAETDQQLEELVSGYLGTSNEVKQLLRIFLGPKASSSAGALNTAIDAKGRQQRAGERRAGSVMIRHVPGRKAVGSAQPPIAIQKVIAEKDVCNCLCCGKIYFTMADTADTASFLESGGQCTFCGAIVALSRDGISQSKRSNPQQTSAEENVGGKKSADQAAEAKAFKDRLVDYDRNARQRTTVVDDQNDFFEIDTNAWLEPEEREELKRQEKEMQEAEEARKRRVTVTLDLLGRRVVMADDAGPTALDVAKAEASLAAAKATGAERRQGGGTAAASALQTAARIQPNLSTSAERPMFVATVAETADERRRRHGIPPSEGLQPAVQDSGVVGGWGDEIAGHVDRSAVPAYERDKLGRAARPNLAGRTAGSSNVSDASERRVASKAPGPQRTKIQKRPQLNRLQHDDIFKDVDTGLALDDTRPED